MNRFGFAAPSAGCAVAALVVLLGGCDATQPARTGGSAPSSAPMLRVAAASDLQTALPALATRFTDRTGIPVGLTFGSSGQLAAQIKAGAPFDVFLAANQQFVKDLATQNEILPDSVRPYARGSLVLAVHRESGRPIQGLADLARADVRKVALANPDFAPYGAAGKQVLERSGLWMSVKSKVVQAESVRQALQFVQSGNAEAGLVGKSIARVPEVRVIEVDPGLYDPIIQGLGIVTRTRDPKSARAFADFVAGADGQSVLVEYGFSKVGASP
jgi:molybdate transport system substrate-binding protein